jgi:hypothetical protein
MKNNKNGLNNINVIKSLFVSDILSFHSNVHIFLKYLPNMIIGFDSLNMKV